ncbi:hypothetical protein E4K65_41680 [Bradyrhizobium niftali]|uniref:Uncharacterized protein n=1 Tax=Bradyrhizobium niftali TaxID=2560055 RepID=A0A4Y9L4P2_9BRAD|nr:hypothetical protein E4K65_41680 [Bradyrhizobium niftali]
MAGLDPAIHALLALSRRPWMPGSSPGMTENQNSHRTQSHAPSPHLHGHARFLRADAARARRPWP